MKYGKPGHRLDMFPGEASNDVAHDALMDAVSVRDGLLCQLWIQAANVADVLLGKFRRWVILTERIPALVMSVLVVVGNGANEQMGWIDARRIVTAMQYVSLWRHRAVDAFVRNTMSAKLAAFLISNDAVAFAVSGACPQPTGVSFSGMVVEQEPLHQRDEAGTITTCLRAEQRTLPGYWAQVALLAHWSSDSWSAYCHGMSIQHLEYVN